MVRRACAGAGRTNERARTGDDARAGNHASARNDASTRDGHDGSVVGATMARGGLVPATLPQRAGPGMG
jgi:hypothetical protein